MWRRSVKMKIVICGSMAFSKEIIEAKENLEKLGNSCVVPAGVENYASDKFNVENKWEKIEFDVIRKYFEEIKNSDVVLIVNKDKNGIKNYLGGNSLIEMAFAHVLNKKIFLLNPIPILNYSDEIEAMKSIIINNNFENIR